MLIETVEGKCFISDDSIIGTSIYKGEKDIHVIYIYYPHGQVTIPLASKDRVNKFMEELEALPKLRTQTELEKFKDGVEYALKLIEKRDL